MAKRKINSLLSTQRLNILISFLQLTSSLSWQLFAGNEKLRPPHMPVGRTRVPLYLANIKTGLELDFHSLAGVFFLILPLDCFCSVNIKMGPNFMFWYKVFHL